MTTKPIQVPTLLPGRVGGSHHASPLACARSTRKSLTISQASSRTVRNSSTESAEPRPRAGNCAMTRRWSGNDDDSVSLGAPGHHEDVVEDAEGVERPEQHGDHDRRPHVGRITFQSRCHQVAPSTSAASIMSSDTCERPASRSSAMKGVVFQISETADREHRRPVATEPVGLRADPGQPREPGVHEAVVEAEGEPPGVRRDHGDDAVGMRIEVGSPRGRRRCGA